MSNPSTATRLVQGRTQHSGNGGWAFAIFLLTVVPATIFNGWVLSVIWNWFMPVIFSTLHPLTIIQALGLSLVISLFISARNSNDKNEGKSGLAIVLGSLLWVLLRGGLFLLLGFIYQLFI